MVMSDHMVCATETTIHTIVTCDELCWHTSVPAYDQLWYGYSHECIDGHMV